MGLLEDGAAWLDKQRCACLSVPVTYRHRYGEVRLKATIGKTLFRLENEYGVTTRVESRDFIVSAAECDFIPEKGDRIEYAGRMYEVLAAGDEPVWRWCGNTHDMLRIHTKEVGYVDRT